MHSFTPEISWEWVAEFLALPDVTASCLVCRAWNRSIQETVSPRQCAIWLSKRLQEEGLYLTGNVGSWRSASDESIEAITRTLIKNSTVPPLRTLCDTLRVMSAFPKQAAVTFSAEYGRHCVPLQWDTRMEAVVPVPNDSCRRPSCTACRLQIPRRTRFRETAPTDDCVDDYFDILGDNGQYVELKKYYPACVPSLPADLHCPICNVASERTLQLTEFSYISSTEANNWNEVQLTFTPATMLESPDHAASSKSWKHILYAADSFPPAPFRDVSIPIDRPPPRNVTAKHVLAIHCESCEQFGLLGPAVVCSQGQFQCQDRLRYINFGNAPNRSLTGAVMVRRQCSHPKCNRPTLCHRCCRTNVHRNEDATNGAAAGEQTTTLQSHCETCQLTFCIEHHWQSTVCHHW